jgi:hypothetical protein
MKPRARRVLITPRDLALLHSLAEYRYLSLEQIKRLHFSSEQTASRRLRFLSRSGHVELFRVPGVPQRLVTLAPAGMKLVTNAQCGAPSAAPLRREVPKDAHFVRHFLAISDFRVGLEQATAESQPTLIGFIPEYRTAPGRGSAPEKLLAQRVPDPADPQRQVAHCPDGAFALGKNERAALFFLEVDRGTEVIGDADRGVLKAIRFYLGLLTSGSYQRFSEPFGLMVPFRGFRTLFVVSSEVRVHNIRQRCGAITGVPDSLKRFLWLCSQQALARASPLSVEFVSADPTDKTTYTIAPTEPTQRRTSCPST